MALKCWSDLYPNQVVTTQKHAFVFDTSEGDNPHSPTVPQQQLRRLWFVPLRTTVIVQGTKIYPKHGGLTCLVYVIPELIMLADDIEYVNHIHQLLRDIRRQKGDSENVVGQMILCEDGKFQKIVFPQKPLSIEFDDMFHVRRR